MKNVRRTMNVRRTARLLILALVFGMAMYAVYVVVWPSLPSSSAVVTPLELSHAATARGVVTLVNDGFAWEQPKPNKAGWTPEPESATCYTVPGRGFIGKRCAPSFVIAGAMKSGTTSLYAYLLQHPQIERVTEEPVDQPRTGAKSHKIKRLVKKPILAAKEVRFWMDPNYRRLKEELGGIDEALQWYYDLFAPIPAPSDTLDSAHESNRGKIAGEATPMYICQPGVAVRIRQALPKMKVILLLRNPIDRALSEYFHRVTLKSTQQELHNATTTEWSKPATEHQSDFDRCVRMDAAVVQHCLKNPVRGKTLHPLYGEFDAVYNCTNQAGMRLKAKLKQERECELPFLKEWCEYRRANNIPKPKNVNDTACLASHGVRNGLYDLQLLEWYRSFPREQILTIASERFYSDTASVMKEIERFLGLQPLERWNEIVKDAYNIAIDNKGVFAMEKTSAAETHAYPPMRDDTREFLRKFYQPHVMQLERITGEDFSSWYSE